MKELTINGVVQAEYLYNARGQQVVRRLTQSVQTIHSVHDLDGNRIAEYDYDPSTQTATLIREYLWMDGRAVGVIENGTLYYVRTDWIGRPAFATNCAGTKVWEATYLPFGGVHTSTGTPLELRFPGQWFQSESGLHKNWMRDYDPTTGRYIQADPLGLVDGASAYNYAMQNPGRYIDSRGEKVVLMCRPLKGSPGIWGGERGQHCSVFVVDVKCECTVQTGVVAQFSLAQGMRRFDTQGRTSVYWTDRGYFFGAPRFGTKWTIPVPSGMTDCEFDLRVIALGNGYSQGPYNAILGPNSNTAARRLIELAGGTAPNIKAQAAWSGR